MHKCNESKIGRESHWICQNVFVKWYRTDMISQKTRLQTLTMGMYGLIHIGYKNNSDVQHSMSRQDWLGALGAFV